LTSMGNWLYTRTYIHTNIHIDSVYRIGNNNIYIEREREREREREERERERTNTTLVKMCWE